MPVGPLGWLSRGLPLFLLVSTLWAGEPVTLRVDASASLGAFRPAEAFGANTFPYAGKQPHFDVQKQVEAAGQVFLRYPDGYAEYYHWNGKGVRDAQGVWVPDREQYAPGFKGALTRRGTTSNYGDPSCVTDGNPSTSWLSNRDASDPSRQWLILDLKNAREADAVSILWGTPRAKRFKVQYWKSAGDDAWAIYQSPKDRWTDTTASDVQGRMGTQVAKFTAVTSRYFRIVFLESAARPAAYSVAELSLLRGTEDLTRHAASTSNASTGGADPDQTWVAASTTDPACRMAEVPGLDFESFMAFAKSFKAPVSPLLTVNMAGTPQEAAAWVHYANRVKGYGVKYWELGNEMNGHWEAGGPWGAKEYARQFVRFGEAMRAEDPSIVLCGPGVSDAYAPSNDYDGKTFIQGFVDEMSSLSKTSLLGAVDFHWYPDFMNDNRSKTWATVDKIAGLPEDIKKWTAQSPEAGKVPVLLSEFNTGAFKPFSTGLENALWLANTYGEFLKAFSGRDFMGSYWCLLSPSDAATNVSGGDQGYLQLSDNDYRYQPRSTYWALWMLSAAWSQSGDTREHQLVKASSDDPSLPLYADLRPDGSLSLLVVNKDLGEAKKARLELGGFRAGKKARCWTYDATRYQWNTKQAPYHADPNLPPALSEPAVQALSRHVFPPSSLTVIELAPQGKDLPPLPTMATPGVPAAVTASWDATENALDDFEDPGRDGPPPARVNLWGGPWESYKDAQSSVTLTYDAPGAEGAGRSAHFRGVVSQNGWSCFQSRLQGGWPPTPMDLVLGGAKGIEFLILGDGKPYRVLVQTRGITDYDYYGTTVTPPRGVWTKYRADFKDLRRGGWGKQSPAPPEVGDLKDALGVQVSTQQYGPFEVRLDDFRFVK